MAVNMSRSMNADLADGCTDGKYRKARPNTTVAPGTGNEKTMQNRSGLHPWWNYGYPTTEEPTAQRVNPGG